MARARWLLGLLAVAAVACDGGRTPTSPGGSGNPGGGTPPGGPSPSPGAHVVSGSVVNALDDSPAGMVSFSAAGTLLGRSETNGQFSVGFPLEGVNAAELAANGFVIRHTGIRAPNQGIQLSLIPASFDLTSFNQMFRHAPAGLTRWRTPPALLIERRVLQFTEVGAATYTALEETLTDAEVAGITTDMTDGYALLTAGRLGTFSSIGTQVTAPGDSLAVSHPGKIVVTRQVGLTSATGFWGYARWATTPDGEVTRGFIILDDGFERSASSFHRSLRMHELGHTLGCQHVDPNVRLSVMNSNARTQPNEFDTQAARIAMLRPPGNRAPDTDPPTYIATTAARTMQPAIWHGAH